MEAIIVLDDNGVIEDFDYQEEAIFALSRIRDDNTVNGDLIVAEIIHVSN